MIWQSSDEMHGASSPVRVWELKMFMVSTPDLPFIISGPHLYAALTFDGYVSRFCGQDLANPGSNQRKPKFPPAKKTPTLLFAGIPCVQDAASAVKRLIGYRLLFNPGVTHPLAAR